MESDTIQTVASVGKIVTEIGSTALLVGLGFKYVMEKFSSKSTENGNGKNGHELIKYRLDEDRKDIDDGRKNLEKLTQTANHNFTQLTKEFSEHKKADDAEFKKSESFRIESRYFMLAVSEKLGVKIPKQNE